MRMKASVRDQIRPSRICRGSACTTKGSKLHQRSQRLSIRQISLSTICLFGCVLHASDLCVSSHDTHRGTAIPMPQQLPQLCELHRCVLLSHGASQHPNNLIASSGFVLGCWAFTGAEGVMRPGCSPVKCGVRDDAGETKMVRPRSNPETKRS